MELLPGETFQRISQLKQDPMTGKGQQGTMELWNTQSLQRTGLE